MNPIKNFLQDQQKAWNIIFTLGRQAKQINPNKFWLINLVYSLILIGFIILFKLQPKPLERNFAIIAYYTFSFFASLFTIFISWILAIKNLADSKPKQDSINP